MKFELKKLSADAVPAALRKAEHYRLLNEPRQAESICRDILLVEPRHQPALITLVLALTDQFDVDTSGKAGEARKLLERLPDSYERSYYMGLVNERRATAYLQRAGIGSGGWAYDYYRQAMEWYEAAERMRPAGNDDALLRWNTCARIIEQNKLEAVTEQYTEAMLE